MTRASRLAWGVALALGVACGGGGSPGAGPTGDASTKGATDGGSGSGSGSSGGGDATTGGDGAGASDAAADAWAPLPPTPDQPQLWYWHHSYLSPTSTTEPAHSEQLVDQAVAAGYTGLVFWDSSLTFANRPGWDTTNLATVVQYAKGKGMTALAAGAPYGYSNDMLQADPNQAEGAKVVGGQFVVTAGSSGNVLQPVNTLPPIVNGGFESGMTTWFGTGDARTSVDTTVAHTGTSSGKITGDPNASDNARFTQAIDVTPWRLYHVQLWFQTAGFSGNTLNAEVLDFTTQQNVTLTRMAESPTTTGSTQSWTVFDYSFNSRESTKVTLYLGIWGGFSGTVWIDDVMVEETALVNVLRRDGTPLKVYDTTSTTYTEGTDYGPVVDPALAASPGNYDPWHAPPTVGVPAGSKLQAGQKVSMDYYTVVPQIGWEVSSCLSEPAEQTWNHDNAVVLAKVFPPGAGVFLGYDEMRQGDSCALCQSKNMTGGQLLAWNVGQTVSTLQSVWGGGTTFYFWDDMFSPYHNAVANYYDVEGDLTGSWTGLPPGSIIMNWNLGSLAQSLKFFSGTDTSVTPPQPHGFQQIIAGYYDSGDGMTAGTTEMTAAMGIKGLIGVMYTSWTDDYTQLQPYADAVKAAWPAYKASAP
ncbi:MAG TPA: carbohydrate binding domain-containing protein [Polyangiaceae bacterium]